MRFRLPHLAHLVLAAALAASATGGLALSAPAARAAETAASADVALTGISPTVLTPGETLEITGTVHNSGTAAIGDAEVDLQLSETPGPIADRQLLSAWQADETIDDWGWTASAVRLTEPIKAGGSTQFTLRIDASHLPLAQQNAPGAFPCRLDVTTARGVIAVLRTFIVFQPNSEVAPVSISTILPLLASPQEAGTGQGATTGAASPSSIERATRLMADGASAPVDWLVDPALVSADAKDPATSELIEQLAAATQRHDVYRLPWADVDVGAIAAGRAEDLYDTAMNASAAAFKAKKLTNQGVLVWPPFGRIDADTVSFLAAHRSPDALALASSPLEASSIQTAVATPQALVSVATGRLPALVSDDTVTALMTQSDASQPLPRQRIIAELATISAQAQDSTASLFLLPDRAWSNHFAQLEANLRVVTALPWVTTARTSELMAEPAAELPVQPEVAGTSGGALAPSLVERLESSLQAAATYASVTEQPSATLEPLARRLLFPLSVSLRDQPSGREAQALAAVDQVTKEASTISVKQGSDINLVAQSGQMPVSVSNSGTQPVTVTVKLESPDRRLLVPDSKVLTVRPDSEERAMFKVEAVASGDVTLEVRALNAAGAPVAQPSTITVRVRADWEDWGTLGVGLLFGALLIVGLFRSRKKKRADRKQTAS